MKKIVVILILTFSFLSLNAQNQYIHKHLIRFDGSVVGAYMIKENFKNAYLSGNLEYYADPKVSIRGETYFLIGSNGITKDSLKLKDNHCINVGALFHFQTKNNFDPYFLFQPGIAFTSSYKQLSNDQKQNYEGQLTPNIGAGLGFNYYFQRFAHLFIESKYVYAKHISNAPKQMNLSELRFTFGLGFNFSFIKGKFR